MNNFKLKNLKIKKPKTLTANRFSLLAGVLAFAIMGGGAYSLVTNNNNSVNNSQAAGTCTVDDNLVNSCRPWLAAAVSQYPWAGGSNAYDPTAQFPYFEKRLNDADVLLNPDKQVEIVHKLDFVHTYSSGRHLLSNYEQSIVNSGDQYLQLNWKPSSNFRDADGSNSSVNSDIDAVAASIKSMAPKKLMLAVYHEPENDITPSSTSCPTSSSGSKGSPAEYRAMWQNVRQRFDNLGVDNVVWAINFMGFSKYDCMIDDLWPGNEYVDWVLWDPYDGGEVEYLKEMKRFYDWMEANSDAQHDYTSKAWGLGEFGYWNQTGSSTDANAPIFWQQAKQSLVNNDMPRVKLYSVFDSSPDTNNIQGCSAVGLTFNNTPTPLVSEQVAFNDFAITMLNLDGSDTGGGGTDPDTENPVGTFTSPSWREEVSGDMTISINATDNVAVEKVEFKVDGIGVISTDYNAPYSTVFDTTRVANGINTIRARIVDTSGNDKSPLVEIDVNNQTSSFRDSDLNQDTKVDIIDLSILLSAWGQNGVAADINSDNAVDIVDLSILLSSWD